MIHHLLMVVSTVCGALLASRHGKEVIEHKQDRCLLLKVSRSAVSVDSEVHQNFCERADRSK